MELAIEARSEEAPPTCGLFSFKNYSLMPITDDEF